MTVVGQTHMYNSTSTPVHPAVTSEPKEPSSLPGLMERSCPWTCLLVDGPLAPQHMYLASHIWVLLSVNRRTRVEPLLTMEKS
jgi:hypothetical protein